MYVVCLPDRVGPIFKLLQEALEQYARIQVHLGKTQVWNRGGHVPPACVEMQAAADRADPQSQARIWRGAGLPSQQGIRVLGIPIGHKEYVQAELRATTEKHSILLNRIPLVQDLQSAWLLLLFYANHTCHVFPSRDSTCRNRTVRTRTRCCRLGTLSSQNTFIQKHFHPKTLSSKNTFILKHFRPKQKTISSTTLSSQNGFQ